MVYGLMWCWINLMQGFTVGPFSPCIDYMSASSTSKQTLASKWLVWTRWGSALFLVQFIKDPFTQQKSLTNFSCITELLNVHHNIQAKVFIFCRRFTFLLTLIYLRWPFLFGSFIFTGTSWSLNTLLSLPHTHIQKFNLTCSSRHIPVSLISSDSGSDMFIYSLSTYLSRGQIIYGATVMDVFLCSGKWVQPTHTHARILYSGRRIGTNTMGMRRCKYRMHCVSVACTHSDTHTHTQITGQ